MSSKVPTGVNLVLKTFSTDQECIKYMVYTSKTFIAEDWGIEGDIYSTNDTLYYVRTHDSWERAIIDITHHPKYGGRFLGLSRGKPLWLSRGTKRSRTSKQKTSELVNDGRPAKRPRGSQLGVEVDGKGEHYCFSSLYTRFMTLRDSSSHFCYECPT